MTYLQAAHEILKEAGEALHYKVITERALEQGLIQPSGLTPDATMGSRLYTDIKYEGSWLNTGINQKDSRSIHFSALDLNSRNSHWQNQC